MKKIFICLTGLVFSMSFAMDREVKFNKENKAKKVNLTRRNDSSERSDELDYIYELKGIIKKFEEGENVTRTALNSLIGPTVLGCCFGGCCLQAAFLSLGFLFSGK